ncbi:MAG TPA: LysE family transporter, partial [Actinomycetota bacterium]|nr:LysE family transporter [Actinomycetota bacterium]
MVGGETLTHVAAGFGIGVALAGAPGPVQAILLGESLRGGIVRGFRTMIGANLTFGVLLLALALGLSVAPPSGLALRILKVVGGAFLLWLAVEGLRASHQRPDDAGVNRRRTLS